MRVKKSVTRLDWSDPDMKVVRAYRFGDGTTKTEIDPDYEQRYRQHQIETSNHPSWKDDSTYELRRKK